MAFDRARSLIRDVPDFPHPGILFKDITPVLGDAAAFSQIIDGLAERLGGLGISRIAAVESRGFLFGAALADRLKLPLAPIRKLGKLPYQTDRVEYALEYGTGTLEAHVDAIKPGDTVAVVDDLLATGGTAWAAAQLVQKQGGKVGVFLFAIELEFLKGRDRLGAQARVESLIRY